MAYSSADRVYDPNECAIFLKTSDEFGGLSNMAPGYPLFVTGAAIRTSEALYQACRFPNHPELQDLIINQMSPMTAKMKSKPFRDKTRDDWMGIRVNVMRWCLRVKLLQNYERFSVLLQSTGDRPIVEKKLRRSDFWGALERPDGMLVGRNALGRLLMELREAMPDSRDDFLAIPPPSISNFLLLGKQIREVKAMDSVDVTRQNSLFS